MVSCSFSNTSGSGSFSRRDLEISADCGCSTGMFSASLTLSLGWDFWVPALPQARQLGAHTITAHPRRTLLGVRGFLTQARHRGLLISRCFPLFVFFTS